MSPQLRQTAYKVWIGDLLKADFLEKKGDWDPNYFLIGKNKVSRVNIIASVVNVYENEGKTMRSVDVDDSSGSISLKVWSDGLKILESLEVGDICLVIGKCKNSSGQIFITPEIVKKVDGNWAKLRRFELEKLYGKREEVKPIVNENAEHVEEPIEGPRQKVLNILEKSGEIRFEDLLEKSQVSEENLKSIINDLLKEGEIFEPKPNHLRVV